MYLSQEKEPDFPASLIAQYKDKNGNDLSLEDFNDRMPVVDTFRQGEEKEDDDNGLSIPPRSRRLGLLAHLRTSRVTGAFLALSVRIALSQRLCKA